MVSTWGHWYWWGPFVGRYCMVKSPFSAFTCISGSNYFGIQRNVGTHLRPVFGVECHAPKGAQGGVPDTRVAKFAPKLSLITNFQSLWKVQVFLRSKTNSLTMRNTGVLDMNIIVFNHHLKISCKQPNNWLSHCSRQICECPIRFCSSAIFWSVQHYEN